MKKITIILIGLLALAIIPQIYADNFAVSRIFNKVTAGLVSGNSRYISLDDMKKILKTHHTVEFHSLSVEPAKDMILNEIAFRMLKQHYLPSDTDKIHVYAVSDTPINMNEVAINLPVEITTVRDNEKLKTIYWGDMVFEVSSAIEKLWIRRLGILENKEVSSATAYLKKKFIQNIETSAVKRPALAGIIEERLAGMPEKAKAVDMFIQYLTLSASQQALEIANDLQEIKSLASLKTALLKKIENTAISFVEQRPYDYAGLAMFQSLLNEYSTVNSSPIANINTQKSRRSA